MKFGDIANLPESVDRTAQVVEWFQSLFDAEGVPVLVGGAAVELYTGGAYQTGDLDFAGLVPSQVGAVLQEEGFQRVGRHWAHERFQLFIELPSSSLQSGETAVKLIVGKAGVVVVGPEELIVDRLAAWQFWNSEQDGVNAFLIWQGNQVKTARLRELAESREVLESLDSLAQFRDSCGGKPAQAQQLQRWATRGS